MIQKFAAGAQIRESCDCREKFTVLIMNSQELDQHSKIPTTKVKAISCLNKGPNDRGEGLYPSHIKE